MPTDTEKSSACGSAAQWTAPAGCHSPPDLTAHGLGGVRLVGNQVMLALAYDAALRWAEARRLQTAGIDLGHGYAAGWDGHEEEAAGRGRSPTRRRLGCCAGLDGASGGVRTGAHPVSLDMSSASSSRTHTRRPSSEPGPASGARTS